MPVISVQPEGWAPPKGYANGMVGEGRILCVGGQIGWTAEKIFETDDFIGQMKQALRNVVACLLYTSPSPRDEQSSRMPSSA